MSVFDIIGELEGDDRRLAEGIMLRRLLDEVDAQVAAEMAANVVGYIRQARSGTIRR